MPRLHRIAPAFAILAALAVLVPAIGFAAAFGSTPIPFRTVLRTAFGLDSSGIPDWQWQALRGARFPRVLVLAVVGGALSNCGAVLQSVFRNPMADPAILGVSGGGALGAVLAVMLGFADRSLLALALAAFAGATLAALMVHGLARLSSRPGPSTLLLTGIAVSSLCSAVVSLILTTWTKEYQLKYLLFWLVGGAESRSWEHLQLVLPPALVVLVLLILLRRIIDALATGDEHALSVGVPVARARLSLLLLCALSSGAAVAVAGPIAFVGLMVPNGVRLLVGGRAALLIPVSFIGGAAFLVLCDLAVRTAFREITVPVGLVTSILGVPYFLWLLARPKGRR